MKYICLFTIIMVLCCSCKKETLVSTANAVHYSYFPLQNGNWIIYEVDSIAHLMNDDGTNQPDTSIAIFHFKIKEVIESSFIDGQGNTAYYVARYRMANDSMPWIIETKWVALLTNSSAQRVEENIRYVKLSFPIDQQSTWNGNAYNYLSDEEYSYSDIHVPLSIGLNNFDSTVTVLQVDEFNFLYSLYKVEQYAKNIGMIYKRKDSLNFNNFQQVTNGYEYKETILSYGN